MGGEGEAMAWQDVGPSMRARVVRQWLRSGYRFRMAFGEPEGDAVALRYVFTDPDGDFRGISSTTAVGAEVESLVAVLPQAHWDEREMQDLCGLTLRDHPDARPLLLPDAYDGPPPFLPSLVARSRPPWQPRVLSHHGIVHVPVGPVHAGIIETGHFAFSAMGETVLQLDLRLGWDHRGIEPMLAGRTLDEAIRVVERTCGNCSASHQEAFSQAVEAVQGRAPTATTAVGRSLVLELERVYNHLNDLSQLATGVGLAVLAQQGLELKERSLRINAGAFGHRYLFGTIRPGWVRLPRDVAMLGQDLHGLAQDSARWVDRLFSNAGFRDRAIGAGTVSRAAALSLGAVGPIARASGIRADARVERPYGAYRDTVPTVVTLEGGDVMARAEVRRQELLTALHLALEFVARVGSDAAAVRAVPSVAFDLSGSGIGMTESPRGATLHYLHVARGRLLRYHMRTASFTNWPLIMVAAQDNPIGDFPLINKSFELCYACSDR